MTTLLVLFIAVAGQDEPIVRPYEQKSLEQCLGNLTRFLSARDLLDMEDVKGISAMCQVTKPLERQAH